jgi:hypothetical protein
MVALHLSQRMDLGKDERLRGAVQMDRDHNPTTFLQQFGDEFGGLDLLAEVDIGTDDRGRREAGDAPAKGGNPPAAFPPLGRGEAPARLGQSAAQLMLGLVLVKSARHEAFSQELSGDGIRRRNALTQAAPWLQPPPPAGEAAENLQTHRKGD